MTIHTLSFGEIHAIASDIAEVIVSEGVEMTVEQVEEYHQCLLNNFTAPFSLLVNKINHYSYTFDAQLLLGTLPEIDVMAILLYSPTATVAQDYLNSLPRISEWHTEQFVEREKAMNWIKNSQKKAASQPNS